MSTNKSIKLTQEQIEAIWESTPNECFCIITPKDSEDIGKVKVDIRNVENEEQEVLFFNSLGMEIDEGEYNS